MLKRFDCGRCTGNGCPGRSDEDEDGVRGQPRPGGPHVHTGTHMKYMILTYVFQYGNRPTFFQGRGI